MSWSDVRYALPNEDEMAYHAYVDFGTGRKISDKVLAVNAEGNMLTGYFMLSGTTHEYQGRCMPTKRDDCKGHWAFGDHYNNDPTEWIVENSNFVPVFWQPLPAAPEGLKEE